ncbi:hypothetical protein [Oceanobacillus sp. 1P07AA]|uniref:hypothetical protein n=1 Tax=Oceanobacillus sp. 1P07AA TaxID=3132293 RepID=UPI0039A56415
MEIAAVKVYILDSLSREDMKETIEKSKKECCRCRLSFQGERKDIETMQNNNRRLMIALITMIGAFVFPINLWYWSLIERG